MPEGDTVWLTARRLDQALAGRTLLASDFRVPRYATVDLSGRVVEGVLSRGKHLLLRAGDLTVHSHLKMEGSWQVYAPGERWRRPAFQARAILTTEDKVAVGFSLGTLQVLPRREESDLLAYLGPDLLGPDWDAGQALTRFLAEPDRDVGAVLLDQRVMAGVGNVYRNELCFLRGLHPQILVRQIADPAKLIDTAFRMLQFNKNRSIRCTTGDERRGKSLWVYRREGQPCRRCGSIIRTSSVAEAAEAAEAADEDRRRAIYWCPRCQPERAN
ncbi:DNA-formamidopyrimidine glycosylase family protein [Saxibacter everestensis]|uniref:DNA-(apurinic or apyrimidinic site) lyase n=1 Tax=Saxibacter everestensis TaxID=2909229 RepID=A0ABY8QQC4_9MICO|nr:DNA-formamidopyrimidine glycosylase family protein [Brevibacteriaceae bacterium ZFBP1038]